MLALSCRAVVRAHVSLAVRVTSSCGGRQPRQNALRCRWRGQWVSNDDAAEHDAATGRRCAGGGGGKAAPASYFRRLPGSTCHAARAHARQKRQCVAASRRANRCCQELERNSKRPCSMPSASPPIHSLPRGRCKGSSSHSQASVMALEPKKKAGILRKHMQLMQLIVRAALFVPTKGRDIILA